MDAGPLGAGNCGHAHSDALSLTLTVGGWRFITDSGTYTYTLDPDKRNHFRSIEAHSAPYIEGRPTSIPSDSPFQWRKIEDPSRFSPCFVGWEMDMLAAEKPQPCRTLFSGEPDSQSHLFEAEKPFIYLGLFRGTGDNAGVSQFILGGSDWKVNSDGASFNPAPGSAVNIQAVGTFRWACTSIRSMCRRPTCKWKKVFACVSGVPQVAGNDCGSCQLGE